MIFYATFRRGQPLAAHYVKLVDVPFEASAVEAMNLMYQDRWCDLYTEDEKPILDRMNLTEKRFGITNYELVAA